MQRYNPVAGVAMRNRAAPAHEESSPARSQPVTDDPDSHETPPSSPAPGTADAGRESPLTSAEPEVDGAPLSGPGRSAEIDGETSSHPQFAASEPSGIDGTGFHRLDPRSVTLDQRLGLVFTAALLAGALVALVILILSRPMDWIFWTVAAGAVLLVLLSLWTSLVWPVIEHRHAAWRLDDTGLEIRRGVFWQHWIAIPVARLQHADVSQGPLQRQFGLATLTVHTAGTQNASVELGGLAHETAVWLRDQLMRQRGTTDVV